MAGSDTYQDAHGSSPHQVERRMVGSTAPYHDGELELRDELLHVQRLALGADVLGAHYGPLDDQEVEPGVHRQPVVLFDPRRRQRSRGYHAGFLDLLDPLLDQLGPYRLHVEPLDARGRLVLG